MYTIQNHRINFALIAFVEIREDSLHLNGLGANIVLDRTTDPNATHALLIDLREVRNWLPANGRLVNPGHIVSMTWPEEGMVKVNAGGTEIWVTDKDEVKALMDHHAGPYIQPLHAAPQAPAAAEEKAA